MNYFKENIHFLMNLVIAVATGGDMFPSGIVPGSSQAASLSAGRLLRLPWRPKFRRAFATLTETISSSVSVNHTEC